MSGANKADARAAPEIVTDDVTRARATALGFVAVLLWALLALFTVGSGATPPFLLAAMSFAIGGAIGLLDIARRGASLRAALGQPARIWALGVLGLFGYHFFYFTALRNAPPAEAGLIAYLWPLLIVLFSALLPGERLRFGHVAGGLIGFAGAAVILIGREGGGLTFEGAHATGFAAAGLCALLWSSYSVLSRLAGEAPTDSVAGFCVAAAVLSALCHLALETTVWPATALEWASVVGLGLGPVGAAFYVWDYGCKRGDIQMLGVAAYAAPLLSTIVLVAAGFGEPTLSLGLGAALIVVGSLAAAAASLRRSAAR
ncbi:MAG: DMT family transporter [Pseudomonadota bacterium]